VERLGLNGSRARGWGQALSLDGLTMPWRECLGGPETGQSPREKPKLGLLVPIPWRHFAPICVVLQRDSSKRMAISTQMTA